MGKGFAGADRLMIICPAAYLLVQLFNQDFLLPSLTTSKDGFRQGRFQGLQCLLGRLDDEFSFELPECPAQHIKAVVNMGDDRLFLGQLQTPGLQEITDDLFGLFCDLFCRRRDDKVIGIPHQVDLALVVDKCTDLTFDT